MRKVKVTQETKDAVKKHYFDTNDYVSSFKETKMVRFQMNFKDGTNIIVVMTRRQRDVMHRTKFYKSIENTGGLGYVKHKDEQTSRDLLNAKIKSEYGSREALDEKIAKNKQERANFEGLKHTHKLLGIKPPVEVIKRAKTPVKKVINEFEGGKLKRVSTIDCTPTWRAALSIYLAALKHGNPDGVKAAIHGLTEMAEILQSYVDMGKDNTLIRLVISEDERKRLDFIKENVRITDKTLTDAEVLSMALQSEYKTTLYQVWEGEEHETGATITKEI